MLQVGVRRNHDDSTGLNLAETRYACTFFYEDDKSSSLITLPSSDPILGPGPSYRRPLFSATMSTMLTSQTRFGI